MTKIDIKESVGRSNSAKSPSPARRDAGVAVTNNSETDRSAKKDEQTKNSDKNREGVSNESGYFEDDDDQGALQQEDSIEIIFDKNASNNNSGNKSGKSGRQLHIYDQVFRPLNVSKVVTVNPQLQYQYPSINSCLKIRNYCAYYVFAISE